jgi:hypothetical protein
MESPSPGMEDPMDQMSDMEQAEEVAVDFSNDARMKTMIGHLAENLENFQEDEHWKDEHYIWLNDFLTE